MIDVLRTWCDDVAWESLRLSTVFPPNRHLRTRESLLRRCGGVVVVVDAIDHEAPTFFAAQFNSTRRRNGWRGVLGLGGALVVLGGVGSLSISLP